MSDRPPEEARRTDLHMAIGKRDPAVLQMFATLIEKLGRPGDKDRARLLRAFAVAVVASDQLDEAVSKYRISAITPKTCGCIDCIWLPEHYGTDVFGSLAEQVLYGMGSAIADDVQKRGPALAGAQFAKFEAVTRRLYCVEDFRAADCCETVLEQLRKVMPEVLAAPLGQQRKVETVAEHNAPADSNLGAVSGEDMMRAALDVHSLIAIGKASGARVMLNRLCNRAGRQLCVTDFHQFAPSSLHLESLAQLLPLSPEHLDVLVEMGAQVPVVVLPERIDNGVVSEHVEDQHTTKIVADSGGS